MPESEQGLIFIEAKGWYRPGMSGYTHEIEQAGVSRLEVAAAEAHRRWLDNASAWIVIAWDEQGRPTKARKVVPPQP